MARTLRNSEPIAESDMRPQGDAGRLCASTMRDSAVRARAAMWRGTMNAEQTRVCGIAQNAVRLSVGADGGDDLQADLALPLEQA